MFARASILLALLAVAAPAVSGAAPAVTAADSGAFIVYLHGKSLGTEKFLYEPQGDSLFLHSHVQQMLPGRDGPDSLDKFMSMVVNPLDCDLWQYESRQRLRGKVLRRGLSLDDTLYTAYTQDGEHGSADRLVRPPGRLFVIDPQIFVLFDLMCRNLHQQTFDQRPLSLLVLGSPDSVIEGSAHDLGTETIRWGSKPVQTRKLSIGDAGTQYQVWISPSGKMLRLVQADFGVTVERVAGPIPKKRRPRSG